MIDLFKTHNFLTMGVINITPNSFSDGGQFNSASALELHAGDLLKRGCEILDFGAESTAPFNDPIGESEEYLRLSDNLYPFLKSNQDQFVLSIDTYRPSVFKKVYDFVKSIKPDMQLIFNDVSGVIDQQLIDVLRSCPDAFYVCSFTYVKARQYTSFHMDFVKEWPIVPAMIQHFENCLLQLEEFKKRVILDPCFGFSKTAEQNMELLQSAQEWPSAFDLPFMVGISKKSFLQKAFAHLKDPEQRKMKSEWLHFHLLQQLMTENPKKSIIFRVHDPDITKVKPLSV